MKHLTASQPNLGFFHRTLAIAVLSLSYYGMAELSRQIAVTPQSVTPIWPPDGIATAAVLVFGYQLLPGVLLGCFLANIWAFFDDRSLLMSIISVVQVAAIAIGTTMGIAFSKYLFQRTIRRRNPFARINDAYRFLLLNAAIAPVINATVGVSVLCLGSRVGWQSFGETWLTWWISNVAGICVFTPALMSWYELYASKLRKVPLLDSYGKPSIHRLRDTSQASPLALPRQIKYLWRSLEAIILIVSMGIVSWQSFYGQYDFEYILLPCLVWSVFRFGQLLSTNLIVISTMLAVSGTVRGLGKFGSVNNAHHSLLLLQLFIVVIIVTTLSLIAILAEKQEAIASLKRSKARLTDKSAQLEISKSQLSETALKLESQNLDLIASQKIAEQANQAKSEFLTNVSHELRTPLNAILCLSQILQESQQINSQEQLDLQTIHQSSSHLLYLIEDILNISKIETGNVDINLKSTCLTAFIHDVARIAQVQAQQKNIEFIQVMASDLPEYVEVDDYRLRQILLNLLNNAIKFTEKGKVTLKITCEHPDAVIGGDDGELAPNLEPKPRVLLYFEVQDSGIGIRASDLETIFLPFQQVGDRQFKAQGNGLGLSISQKIAELMGSKITVSSEYGTGSIFRFGLNLGLSEMGAAKTAPAKDIYREIDQLDRFDQLDQHSPNQHNQDVRSKPEFESRSFDIRLDAAFDQLLPLKDLAQRMPLKILLAEDNEVNQKVATRLLHRMGYGADIANNGIKALEMIHQNFYDVVLMDIQMPEMDGLEATQHILQDFKLSRRPYIIAVTANAMASDRQACLNAGMDDYVSKPINLHLLAEALWRSQHG